MSKYFMLLILAVSASFLTGCADEDHYPVSGEECSEDDPVKTIDPTITDCAPSA
ncbi:MAG: hypothetical protein AB8B82_00255 [Roseovarius sp.]